MNKIKLNIQLFAGSVSIGTITETTDIDTNQSTFTIPATMTTSGSTFNNDDAYMTLQWRYSGGSSWTTISKKTFGISTNSSKTKSWTLTLTHNDDGTLDELQFRVQWYITSSTSGTSSTKSYTPTTIPRASEITSITNGTTVYNPTIIWTPLSSDFKYKVEFVGKDTTQNIISGLILPNQTTPYSYNGLPVYHYIFSGSNSDSITATANLYTYKSDGTTLVGKKSKTFNVTLSPDIKPAVTISNVEEADTTMQSLNWGVYVQNKSKIKFLIKVSSNGDYYAESVTTKINTNGETFTQKDYTVGTFFTTNSVLSSSGTNTINAIATDNRGRSATTSTTYNVVAYSNPTISVAQVQRCDINGNITNEGDYCYISYGASISSCSNNNKANTTYKVGYRIHNTGDYDYIDVADTLDSYSASGMLYTDGIYPANRGSGTKLQLSSSNTYDIQFYVEDTFTESTNVQVLDTGFDLMNFNPNGKAMAIGKVSEASANESKLEVAMDLYNNALDLFNDTSGSDWQTMMKNKIDYCIDNMNTNKTNAEMFINGGWSGVNYGFGIFSKIGTVYQLVWHSSTDTYYVRKSGSTYTYKNMSIATSVDGGYAYVPNGIYSKDTGNVGTASGTGKLVIKKANNSEAPNNGVVLEYGNSTTWTGQLYFGDNSTQGVYYNGWYNGTRGSWRRLADEPVSLYDNSSGTNASITNLSETTANFTYLEIIYKTNDDYQKSVKVYSPNGKKVVLDAAVISGNYTYIKSAQYSISGTSITLESNLSGQARIGNSTATQWDKNSNRIYIIKVLGYRR